MTAKQLIGGILPLLLLTGCGAVEVDLSDIPDLSEPLAAAAEARDPAPTLPPELNIPDGAVTCQIEQRSLPDPAGALSDTYRFYDNHGNEIFSIDGTDSDSSVTTHYRYDDEGRISVQTQTDYFGKTTSRFTYDKEGRVATCTVTDDGSGTHQTYYVYDAGGQVKREYSVDSSGVQTSSMNYKNTYDAAGHLVQRSLDYMGVQQIEVYAYDDAGNPVQEVEIMRYRGEEVSRYVTYSAYDAGGELCTQIYYSDGVPMVFQFYEVECP